MPLTPLPQDNTKRYFLEYVVNGINHSMQSRCADTVSDATALSYFTAIAAALQPSFNTSGTFAGVFVAAHGSNVRNPVPGFTPVTGTHSFTMTGVQDPQSVCIAGRSPTGRKSKVFVYGMTGVALTPTWEEDPLTNADMQGFQGLLNSQSDFWLAIDGTKPTWYFRLTFNFNDHFVAFERA